MRDWTGIRSVIRGARRARPGVCARYVGGSHGTRGPSVQDPRAKLTWVQGPNGEEGWAEWTGTCEDRPQWGGGIQQVTGNLAGGRN